MPHILIVNSPYYQQISEGLQRGAIAALTDADATHEVIEVPGAVSGLVIRARLGFL